ncbi:MAG: tetratricopeptide repeat protein, partial [Saprospiraceae bacterium]
PRVNRAAAMILGVMFMSAIYIYWGENSNERLFATHFDDYADPKLYAMRSGGTDAEELNPTLDEAYNFYFEDNFEKAVFLFDSYSQENAVNDRTQFYLGLSYLKMENVEKALPYFESVVAMEKSEVANGAKWYQALSYLKIGEEEKAKPIFEYITTIQDGFYDKKAIEILEEI